MQVPPQALILAAGMGSRLSPLTSVKPKPLIPVGGVPPLRLTIRRLREIEVEFIAINAHHLPSQVVAALADWNLAAGVSVSFEPTLLGTAGALVPLSKWLKAKEVIVYNSDIVTDICLNSLLYKHRSGDYAATLCVLPMHLKSTNPVGTVGDSVVGFGFTDSHLPGWEPKTFTGIQVIDRNVLRENPTNCGQDLVSLYNSLIQKGYPVGSYLHQGYWRDIGTPTEMVRVHADFFSSSPTSHWSSVGFVDGDFSAPAAGSWIASQRSWVWRGASKLSTEVYDSLILEGAWVAQDEPVKMEIRAFGKRLPIGVPANH